MCGRMTKKRNWKAKRDGKEKRKRKSQQNTAHEIEVSIFMFIVSCIAIFL